MNKFRYPISDVEFFVNEMLKAQSMGIEFCIQGQTGVYKVRSVQMNKYTFQGTVIKVEVILMTDMGVVVMDGDTFVQKRLDEVITTCDNIVAPSRPDNKTSNST